MILGLGARCDIEDVGVLEEVRACRLDLIDQGERPFALEGEEVPPGM